jgi:hypothetical protein
VSQLDWGVATFARPWEHAQIVIAESDVFPRGFCECSLIVQSDESKVKNEQPIAVLVILHFAVFTRHFALNCAFTALRLYATHALASVATASNLRFERALETKRSPAKAIET